MKRFIPLFLVVLFFLPAVSWGQTNPGFESNDLTGWTDVDSGTESIGITNARTGAYALSYSTNNSTNQRMENSYTFSVANNSYLHCIAWAIGNNADARASLAINLSGWASQAISTIGTTLTRFSWNRQNTTGSTLTNAQIGLNSRKVTNTTILYWEDVVAYVSSSATTDLTAPSLATSVNTISNADGTAITVTWADGTDAATGSQEALILKASGLNQTPPALNDQGRYSVAGGSSGPNTIGSWTVIGIVDVGSQTFTDNTTSANTQYTFAVYMRDLAYNYSTGTTSSVTALPVQLTSFTASNVNNVVQLNWQTATEVNNYGFEVERQPIPNPSQREGNSSWTKIGFVNGHGNSNSPKSYSFIDNLLLAHDLNRLQYRLKQIDFDGKFEYSNIVEVNVEVPAAFVLHQNSPNPFNPTTEIKFALPKNSNVELSIYNLLGEIVQRLANGMMNAGEHKVMFDASNLSSGVYIYKLTTDNYFSTRKMVLLK